MAPLKFTLAATHLVSLADELNVLINRWEVIIEATLDRSTFRAIFDATVIGDLEASKKISLQ